MVFESAGQLVLGNKREEEEGGGGMTVHVCVPHTLKTHSLSP
jgi:hypothetical protein